MGKIRKRVKWPDRTGRMLTCLVIVFSAAFLIGSQRAPGIHGTSGVDSSVFRYIARGIAGGKLIYRDMFDHKGPLLYLINFIGYKIHADFGIWLLEFANLAATLGFSYLAVKKALQNRVLGMTVVLLSYRLLLSYYDGGNLVEEYSMFFLAVALYYFTCYFLDGTVKTKQVAVCGACFICVCMLRPNGAGAFAVFVLAVLADLCRQKKWEELRRDILAFLLGCVLCLLPFLLYFTVKGIWKDFWECYIVFNGRYTAAGSKRAILAEMCNLFGTGYIPGVLAAASAMLCMRTRDTFAKKWFLLVCLANVLLNFVLCCMSGRGYGHYGMTVLPSLCLLHAAMVRVLLEFCREHAVEKAVGTLLAFGLAFVFLSDMQWLPQLAHNFGGYVQNIGQAGEKEVVQVIAQNTTPEEEILAWGVDSYLYVEADRLAACRLFYQAPLAVIDPKFWRETIREINDSGPRLLVVNKNYAHCLLWDGVSWEYEPIWQNDAYDVYKRKD